MADLRAIAELVIEGDRESVKEAVERAVAEGMDPGVILNAGLIAGMNVVGERMGRHEIYLPEVMMSAKAMQGAMDLLRPLLAKAGAAAGPKVVLGTVKGDIHDIGKNLVRMMLIGAGFEVIDLGTDVPAEGFVRAARDENVRLVGMSAMLTTTMLEMKRTIEALQAAGLREKVKIMVGGAPVTAEYAAQVGADGYGRDAAQAVTRVRELVA